MASLEDLERRLADVEGRLAAQERVAGGIDRDQSDMQQTLRAVNHTVQALHITQSQHTEKLDRILRLLGEDDRP